MNLKVSMEDEQQQQIEEIEVLKSIYDGDDKFKQLDDTTYQYKYVEGDKSFILEVKWGPKYPNEKPKINLDIFYNQHLLPSVKEKILVVVNNEVEQWLGAAMTYTIFECLKDRVGELLADQVEEVVTPRVEKIVISEQNDQTKKQEKKEHLTKAQKRRAWDKAELGRGGEKPRGWDWVDIIRHLSQVPHQSTS